MFKDLLDSKFAEYQAFVRRRMVEDQIAARGVRNGRVLAAMEKVRRHAFVDEYLRTRAYEDHPLPIDEGQTISQPYMVALTAELLELKGSERVLEIGTGSGYQAAVLAELAGELYTVEIFPSLAQKAAAALAAQGYRGIKFRTGDGSAGWPEHAPYDAIILSCATPSVPETLFSQLGPGGRLAAPVGEADGAQRLTLFSRDGSGFRERSVADVRFVPMLRRREE